MWGDDGALAGTAEPEEPGPALKPPIPFQEQKLASFLSTLVLCHRVKAGLQECPLGPGSDWGPPGGKMKPCLQHPEAVGQWRATEVSRSAGSQTTGPEEAEPQAEWWAAWAAEGTPILGLAFLLRGHLCIFESQTCVSFVPTFPRRVPPWALCRRWGRASKFSDTQRPSVPRCTRHAAFTHQVSHHRCRPKWTLSFHYSDSPGNVFLIIQKVFSANHSASAV